ncbi:hypothetical protein HDU98_011955 [Podochytrium sp. JEL0797]|nr:hypothetical protein HDU98_011955 [Podochytrium sp. JEL0797]
MGANPSKALKDLDRKRVNHRKGAPPPAVQQGASPASPPKITTAPESFVDSITESPVVAATWRPDDPENQRTYHAIETSDYVLPSDLREQTRLDLQHHMLRFAFGTHIASPGARARVKNGKGVKVLDVGCANGAWMDALYTQEGASGCEFHGVDIAEDAFERGTISQANLVVGNVLERLPYDDNTFDYVHQRMIFIGIPKNKWTQVVQELIRVTKPGGFVELVEFDLQSFNSGPASKAIMEPMSAAMESRGIDSLAGMHLYDNVVAAGNLINIGSKPVSIPVGWNGDIGKMFSDDGRDVFIAMSDFMTRVLGVDKEEWLVMIDRAVAEWPTRKAYKNFYAVYGEVKK